MSAMSNIRRIFRARDRGVVGNKWAHFLNMLSDERLGEIVSAAESDAMLRTLTDAVGKKVIFFSDQKHKYLQNKIYAIEPHWLLSYVYRGEDPREQRPGTFTVLGDVKASGLRRGGAEFLVMPAALEDARTVRQFVATAADKLGNNGRLVIGMRHPTLEMMLTNQNPSSSSVVTSSVAEMFRLLKAHDLYIEDVSEGVADKTLRAYFVDDDGDHFHEYQNTPLALVFRAVKFQKSSRVK